MSEPRQPSQQDQPIAAGEVVNANAAPAGKPVSPALVKLQEYLAKNFSNVFSETHWPYTLVFFIAAVFLAFLQFFKGVATLTVGLFVATSFIITFGIFFALSNLKSLEPHIIKGATRKKLSIFLLVLAISMGITIIGFITSSILPPQYHFDIALPVAFIIVYFGWNFIQIFFIKNGLEIVSMKAEKRAFRNLATVESKRSSASTVVWLSIFAPFGMQIGILAFLLGGSTDTVANLWSNVVGQIVFMSWFGGTFFLLVIASLYILAIHRQTVKHDTPSVFAPLMHLLFYVYILFRGFGFINAMSKAILGQTTSFIDQVLDAILLVFTLLLLFKGLGSKLSKTSVFTLNNLPFIAYMFATVVIMGIMSLVLGISVGGSTVPIPQGLVSAINNLMMMSVAVIAYFLYLKRKLMQEDYLERDNYSAHEVSVLLGGFVDELTRRNPSVDKISTRAILDAYLLSKELVPAGTPGPVIPPQAAVAPVPVQTSPATVSPPVEKKAGIAFKPLFPWQKAKVPGPGAGKVHETAKDVTGQAPASPAPPADGQPGEATAVESKYPVVPPKKIDDEKD